VVLELDEDPDSTLEKSVELSEDDPEDPPSPSSQAADAPPPSKVPPAATMPAPAAVAVAVLEAGEDEEDDEELSLHESSLAREASGCSESPDFSFQLVGVHLNSRSGCQ
jgi:hypothetical protein